MDMLSKTSLPDNTSAVPSSSLSTLHTAENIDRSHLWRPRVALISGGIMIASVFHVLIGALGLVGLVTRFVGPITLAPCIGLIGIGLRNVVVDTCKQCWPVAFFTILIGLLCGIVLDRVKFPCPVYDRKNGCHANSRYPIFKIFNNNFALVGGWVVCLVLTAAGVFPSSPNEVGFYARTDAKLNAVFNSNWINLPYPGQWGTPTISYVAVCAFLPIVLGSVMESIGDYIATGNACEVGRPPIHAINRGIMMEGVASIFSGAMGTCHATTSYSNMVGLITYTGVCSRSVWIIAGLISMASGIFGKFGAILAIVPEPVIGGLFTIAMAMVFSVGVTNLALVDMTSTRNLMVVGLSFILGISIPMYTNASSEAWKTGCLEFDQVTRIFLSNEPIVGSVVACLLDNILPGSERSRGMFHEEDEEEESFENQKKNFYGLPWMAGGFENTPVLKFMPFLPSHRNSESDRCCKGSEDRELLPMNRYTSADEKDTYESDKVHG